MAKSIQDIINEQNIERDKRLEIERYEKEELDKKNDYIRKQNNLQRSLYHSASGGGHKPITASTLIDIVSNGLFLNLTSFNTSSYPGSGTTWFDLSNVYDSTINGASYSSLESSFIFNGTNNSIDCGSISDIDSSSTEFSVEVWLKTNVKGTKSIIQNGSDYNTNSYYLWLQNSTQIVFEVWGGSSFDAVYLTDGYETNEWYQLVGTWKSGERVKLYRNGDMSTNAVWLTGSIQNSIVSGDTNTIIGQRGGSYAFNGNISIVRLYDRALTQEEVNQNFESNKSTFGL